MRSWPHVLGPWASTTSRSRAATGTTAAGGLEQFWLWAEADAGGLIGPALVDILHHVETFWERRQRPGVLLFHYSDLLADLPGQLRRLAEGLSIDITDARIEQYAAAARFDHMKERADELVPDVGNGIWHNNRAFFHRGHNGQWRGLLDDEALRRCERRVDELVPADLAAWAHAGWSQFGPTRHPHQFCRPHPLELRVESVQEPVSADG